MVTPAEAASLKEDTVKKYDRIYIGSHFCANLIPKPNDLFSLAGKGARKITVVTPLVTDRKLKETMETLSGISKAGYEIELTVNDMGLLNAAVTEFKALFRINIGLTAAHDLIRTGKKFLNAFVKRYGIKYIESDEKAMIEQVLPWADTGVAYYPDARFLAFSRLCPTGGCFDTDCRRACAFKPEIITKFDEDIGLIINGNAYFKICQEKAYGPKSVKRTVAYYWLSRL